LQQVAGPPTKRAWCGRQRWVEDPHIAAEHRAVERGQPSTPKKTETMTFNHCCFRDGPGDHIMVANTHTRSPLMNHHASKNSVPPSVGADVSGIETLLNRNLPEVFGEGDPARRRAAIQELYTEDCVLYVPPGTFVGHDALDKFAGDLRATHPHYVYTPHGAPQVLHNSGRLAWGSGPKGETPVYTGVDFMIARDGKIAALYVYLDSTPA
jgi:SnoaL-like domain